MSAAAMAPSAAWPRMTAVRHGISKGAFCSQFCSSCACTHLASCAPMHHCRSPPHPPNPASGDRSMRLTPPTTLQAARQAVPALFHRLASPFTFPACLTLALKLHMAAFAPFSLQQLNLSCDKKAGRQCRLRSAAWQAAGWLASLRFLTPHHNRSAAACPLSHSSPKQ